METTIMNNMCRCCASEGAFKDIKTTYRWMGEDEVYGDMLKDCFDITLSASDSESGICEVCITQLRNAANFKKQVLHTEEQFLKHGQNKLFKPNIVKVELPVEDVLDGDDNNLSGDDAFSGAEYELPIKTEKVEEPKTKKRAAAKASTSRSKKQKTSDGEDTPAKSAGRNRTVLNADKERVKTLNILENKCLKKKNRSDPKEIKEILKHRHNVKTILQYSNATPIHGFGSIGYKCSFCSDQYLKADELKKHIQDHDDGVKLSYLENKTMKFIACLDITSLSCNLCGHRTSTLELLMEHLNHKHDKKIYTDIKNQITVFRFEDNVLKCVFCSQVLHSFKRMREHLNSHYRNYVCDVCGAGYINRTGLAIHLETHKVGTFKCEQCDKIFDTLVKKKSHEKGVHLISHLRLKCGFCGEMFRHSDRKNEHLVNVHGLKPRSFKCGACDKIFNNSRRLSNHTKRDHLMERKFKCSKCDMKFFQNDLLKNHMIKHTGSKEFKCEVCTKGFGRKTTLTEHMRIHNNDRRFKCEHCGQAFVQKCSWKAHNKNKHGYIV
ncbi:zinc finger protein 680 isoform X4 [Manduca sexta]|uniref:zinc finger protein 680 isoform X4 n=1 Tax=Manduca sexta TaxID=7130 RepID=UPI001182538B|nr:zinc finger protein 680 isoform X4 [Manduca sexta]